MNEYYGLDQIRLPKGYYIDIEPPKESFVETAEYCQEVHFVKASHNKVLYTQIVHDDDVSGAISRFKERVDAYTERIFNPPRPFITPGTLHP